MKKHLLSLLILFLTSTAFAQYKKGDEWSLEKLLDQNMVEVVIEGFQDNDKYEAIDHTGVYYGLCMTMDFTTSATSSVGFYVPAGAKLVCSDTSYQDMIVTKGFDYRVYPHSTNAVKIFAMCGEIYNSSPRKGIYYTYGGLAEPHVVRIARTIDSLGLQTFRGQCAMWAVANGIGEEKMKELCKVDERYSEVMDILDQADMVTNVNEEYVHVRDSVAEFEANQPLPETDDGMVTIKRTWIYLALDAVALLFIVMMAGMRRTRKKPK